MFSPKSLVYLKSLDVHTRIQPRTQALYSAHAYSLEEGPSELNVDNWNDNCEAKSEAKSPRLLRGLQVDSSLTRNVPYAVR